MSTEKIDAAAKAMSEIEPLWWEQLEKAAILPAWAVMDKSVPNAIEISDRVAKAAVQAVKERLMLWATEDDEEHSGLT